MKEIIKDMESISIFKDENHDGIEVNRFLTYAQIQNICNKVCQIDEWADREQTIDILLLHYATNLTDKDIESIGHEALLKSGVINFVKENVINYNRIKEAIDYTQSTQRALAQILKELPDILEPLKKVSNKYADKPSSKR